MYEFKLTAQKTKLATAISAALSIAAGPVSAQQGGDAIEEVVVTGIRGSLQQALDIKRNSAGVVDAISAEDIGKFPDTNLAESLQRITGVSINRVNGEGSEVTIRGFSGDFNLVTLNGRMMPAADAQPAFFGINAFSTGGDSRSFDFSNLASEGVAGLQVYKTGRASVPSGGIGGTINIQTLQPLTAGNQYSFGAKAMQDDGASGVTPELSGLASWVNDAGTFGVSAFASYQDREFSNRTAGIAGSVNWTLPFDPASFPLATVVNQPGPDDLAGFPSSAYVAFSENQRERTNAALNVQFAPNDQLTVTADGLFAQNDQSQQSVSDLPFFIRNFDFLQFDANPVVSLPEFIGDRFVGDGGANPNQGGGELPFRNSLFELRDELYSFGLNIEYEINDSLTFGFDVSTGEATSGGNHPSGAITEAISIGGQAVAAQFIDYRTAIPNAIQAIADGAPATSAMVNGQMVTFPGGNANGVFEPAELGAQYALRNFADQTTSLDQIHLKLGLDDGGPIRANFGMSYIENELELVTQNFRDELGGWNTSTPGDIATLMGEDAIQSVCILCEFDDPGNRLVGTDQFISDYTAAGGTIAPGAGLRRVGQEAYFVDPFAFFEAFDGYTNASGTSTFDNENRSLFSTGNQLITEDVFSVYAEAMLEGEVADMPIQVVAGLRYEQTDVESTSIQSVPLAKVWTSDNDFIEVLGPDQQAVTQTYDYDNLLPNIDVSMDVNDNLKARVSFSKTLARAPYSNMFVNTSAGNPNTATALGGFASGSRGNAQLDPLESNNFDVSLEYYYGEGSAFTVAFFDKSVSNFIGNEQITTNLFDLRDVSSGAPGSRSGQAIEELQARGYDVTETSLFTMTAILDNPAAFPNGADDYIDTSEPGGRDLANAVSSTYDIAPDANDPLLPFIVQQPTNAENAEIDGWELNWVHFFTGALEGFGYQANATFVNGDIGFDFLADPNTEDQFALTGLSDSANLQLFYENERFGARVLYNWRDEFLANTNVGNRVPLIVDQFSQLDFSASYAATDNLTFTLEGINLLEEPVIWRGRTERQLLMYVEGDMRFLLGARYVFQ